MSESAGECAPPGFFGASGSSPGSLEYALAYAAQGMAVFPLGPGAKEPLGGHGHLDATTDPEEIKTMWATVPEAGVGNRPAPDEVVIDVDPRSDGEESFAVLVGRLGPLPPTVTTETGGGGLHYRLRIPPGVSLPKQLARGIDLKGHNGYVVLPPSRHPNRREYRWAAYCSPEEQNVAELPEAWVEELRKGTRLRSVAAAAETVAIDPARLLNGVPEGHRDEAIFRYACQMRRRGLDRAEAERLASLAAQNCRPPFPVDEVLKKVEQAWRYDGPAPACLQSLDFLVMSASAFLDSETQIAPSLLGEGVIAPETLNILAGDDGVGKTMLALNLALVMAAGRDFVGIPVARPCRVLFIEAEGNEIQFKQRVRSGAASLDIDPAGVDLLFVRDPELFQINGPVLTEAIAKLHPDLVVFDTIGYYYEVREENSNSEWKRLVSKPLRHLARETGTAFLMIQHFGKQNEQRMGKQKIRGSSAQSGDADTTLTLDRAKTNPETDRVLTFAKIKNGPRREPLVLRFDEVGAVFRLIDQNAAVAADPRLEKVQEIVVEGGEIAAGELLSEVQKRLGGKKRAAETLVGKAHRSGLIAHPRKGFYGPVADKECRGERHPRANSSRSSRTSIDVLRNVRKL